MTTDTTTDPPTLAEELRAHAARPFDFYAWCTNTDRDPASDEALDIWTDVGGDPYELAVLATSAADLIGDIAPEVLELRTRMRADVDANPLHDGWRALVLTDSAVALRSADYPHGRSQVVAFDRDGQWASWPGGVRDALRRCDTLAEVLAAYLAAGR